MRRLIIYIISVSLLALLLDALYVGLQLKPSLQAARVELSQAARALSDARVTAAEERFQQAGRYAGDLSSLTAHPSFILAAHAPGVADDAGAVEALVEAAGASARAGSVLVRAARAAGGTREGIAASLYSRGRVRFDRIEKLIPHFSQAARLLRHAARVVQGAPAARLDAIAEGIGLARRKLTVATDATARVEALLDGLPALAARDAKRRYLLAFQTPSEARGGGGLVGLFGVLKAADGRLELVEIAPIGELPAARVRAGVPHWFVEQYGYTGALRQWQQVNFSPNFPVVSRIWLRMYEQARDRSLDGVLAMDPVAFGLLTRATGPLRAPGLDVEIGPTNAVPVILHDSYTAFGSEREQNRYLSQLVRRLWDRIGSGRLDALAFAGALDDAVEGQHLKMYTVDPNGNEALERLDARGDYRSLGPNLQLVFHNNLAANKVDYFLRRTVRTSVRLSAEGSADVRTSIALHNDAPSGPASVLLGPGIEGDAPGLNRMDLRVLMPLDARLRSFGVDGDPRLPLSGREGGYPVISEILHLPPGGRAKVSISYSFPIPSPDWKDGFEMTLLPQATTRPDRYFLSIEPPYGFRIAGRPGSVSAEGGSFRSSGSLDRPITARTELIGR